MGVTEFAGPHEVGSCDFQWAADGLISLSTSSTVDPDKHLVGRLFYPCQPDSSAVGGKTAKQGQPWISSFREATGYASFIFFKAARWQRWTLKQVLRMALWIAGVTTNLPIWRGAAVKDHHAESSGGSSTSSSSSSGVTRQGRYPVLVFSHGLGGTRGTYSVLCAELASQGHVVMAVEHADGTASAVHLAGQGGWHNYAGLGPDEAKFAKVGWRIRELATARQLLHCLNAGTLRPEHCTLTGGFAASALLQGRLDMDRLALVGHSFGGVTVGTATAIDPHPLAAVTLDPWWVGMPPDSAALKQWRTRTPMLVIGSHAWNTPYNDDGHIVAGHVQQPKILKAAHSQGDVGGGALLVVVEGSTHDSFSDLPLLFTARFSWLLSKLGFVTKLDPAVGMAAITAVTTHFLHRRLGSAVAPTLPRVLRELPFKRPAAHSSETKPVAAQPENGLKQQMSGDNGQTSEARNGNGLHGSDNGWSCVDGNGRQQAEEPRRNGGGAPDPCAAADVPSEATRTGQGLASMDPAPGSEPAARAANRSGKFAPSGLGAAGAAAAGAAVQRDAPFKEPVKVPVTETDRNDVRLLLGDLAAILELHA
eukprot:CAMPEP_0206139326 /NCGR_PEP_ID=MMETSP1473-20131121/5532_1 /ASSEMBLY_ACC=CAM_ASM_001109 /TAXON_ID=1461547 /ORGANISM="Stichococcus sp, Strain RCC1054" /LENGTH=591 /DNA_ID=CAMNT_0053533067 /DNA_START=242 /DNA_END=2017 /DNA_ORIENTATION=-